MTLHDVTDDQTAPDAAAAKNTASAKGPVVAGILLLVFGSLFAWQTLLRSDAPPTAGHGGGGGDKGEPAVVDVAKVTRGQLQNARRLPGEVLAQRSVDLAAASAGEVDSVLVELGDMVKPGQVLLKLDRTMPFLEVKRAEAVQKGEQARFDRAKLELERAQADLVRYRKLQQEGALSGRELRDKETATALLQADMHLRQAELDRVTADLELRRAALADTVVRAPFAGTIFERLVEVGGRVAVGTPVFRLLEQGQRRVRFTVPPTLTTPPQPGDRVMVTSHQGTMSATVQKVAQGLTEDTRGQVVEALLDENAEVLPGAFVEVGLSTGAFAEHSLVPVVALMGRGKERTVFVAQGDKVALRNVTVLGEDDVHAAVDGVEAGETVVIRGQTTLSDGDAVERTEVAEDKGDG